MSEHTAFPKVLVISNNGFSKTDSNGRTLGNFFAGWPKDRLAQFYIQNASPDFEVCENYFRVTDVQAVKALLGKRLGGVVDAAESGEAFHPPVGGVAGGQKRNALTMLARNAVWNLGAWKRSGFYAWADEFAPEAVLLQAGDSSFMFALARKTAARYGVPLLIYNSEDYYFRDYDYFCAKGSAHWCYGLFRLGFCREFRRTQRHTAHNVYICDSLKAAYDAEFDTPSTALYTATELKPFAPKVGGDGFTASYLGNFGFHRYEALVEVAEILQSLSPDYYLDVYGIIPNDTVRTAFEGCKGIRYNGFLDYEGVTRVMQGSDLLIHVEKDTPFNRETLRFGFSTKIADSLACGRCFLLYAPETVECYRYTEQNELAYTANSREKLADILRLLTQDVSARERYIANAQSAVAQRHSLKKNRQIFADIIRETVGGTDEGAAN